MKRISLLIFVISVLMITPAFAGDINQDGGILTANAFRDQTVNNNEANALGIGIGLGGAGGNASSSSTAFNTNMIGNGFGNFSPSASARVDNDVRNYYNPTNFNMQGQDQGQLQGQMNNWKQVFINPRPFQNIPELTPFNVPLLNGKVGTWKDLPNFAGLLPYKGEPVIAVKVFNGSIFDRIRLEDIERDILDKHQIVIGKKASWYAEKQGLGWPAQKVRYLVQFKDSAFGAGVGGGGQLGGSGMTGDQGISGMGSVLPGATRSTADPAYIIKFFLTL